MSAPDDEATPVRGITLRVGGMHCGSGAALLGRRCRSKSPEFRRTAELL